MSLVYKIALTGPESTGKSTLTEQLANEFRTQAVPEFARDYIRNLHRPYNYNDIEIIAKQQLEMGEQLISKARQFLFFDTHLIIIKVWFLFLYKDYPAWIDKELRSKCIDLFLLCNCDMPWEPDPLRENGGEMRRILFSIYKNELDYYGYPYFIISGSGKERFDHAKEAILNYFKLPE
jgi:nicotinamide riboside kinase